MGFDTSSYKLYKPRYCVWELTLACNLRCGHCGSRAGQPRPDEMDTAECLDVVRSLARLGCQVITLAGGEPTLHKDWYAIASEIRQRGMIPNMVTNGVTLSPRMAQQMKQAGLANVAVSIDGPQEVHEQIRGPGSFGKSLRALRNLREAGIPTTVMTTINRLNLARLEETHAVALAVGASRWRSQLGKPMGTMQDNRDQLVIRPEDLLTLLPRLYEISVRSELEVSIGDSIGFCGPYDSLLRSVSWDGKPQRWAGCQAGLQAVGIEADGGVKGCLSMQAFGGRNDPFLEGNLRSRALESIWLDPDSFAYNRHFSATGLTGFCGDCANRQLCRGGARCVAAAVTGGLGEDPYCYHRVSSLAPRRPNRRVRRQLATAASVFSLLGAGCGGASAAGEGGSGTGEVQCEEVCCDCGDELPAEVHDLCCVVSASRYGIGVPDDGDFAEDCATCEYGDMPPPPVDCAGVCCDCDYGDPPPAECCPGSAPPYGIAPSEVCLTRAEICDDLECSTMCAANSLDYGLEPPPIPPECGICCEPMVTPAYAAQIPLSTGRIEVIRLGHDLSRLGTEVIETFTGRTSAEEVLYPRDLALATGDDEVRLLYQALELHEHADTCGYFTTHEGGTWAPDFANEVRLILRSEPEHAARFVAR